MLILGTCLATFVLVSSLGLLLDGHGRARQVAGEERQVQGRARSDQGDHHLHLVLPLLKPQGCDCEHNEVFVIHLELSETFCFTVFAHHQNLLFNTISFFFKGEYEIKAGPIKNKLKLP